MVKHQKNLPRQCTVVGATTIGATHIKRNQPNQDALLIKVLPNKIAGVSATEQMAKAFCLSDGHGSKRCFRSHIGAQFAVESLVEAFEVHLAPLCEALDALDPSVLRTGMCGVGKPPLEALRPLAERALKGWVQKVMAHLKEHPFQLEEVDALDYAGKRALGGNALLAYGATLLGVLIVGNRMVGINLGDGDLIVYTNKSSAHHKYEDHNTIGDHTYSLCTSGALAYWYYIVRGLEDVDAIFAATDGYRNSYRDLKGFEQVGTDIVKLSAKKGVSTIEENWESWLSETSRLGSGDDISAAIALFTHAKKEKKRLWR